MKQKLLDIKGQTGPHTVIMGDFNPSCSPTDYLFEKLTRNVRIKLHHRSNKLNTHLQNIYPTAPEYMFFPAAHVTSNFPAMKLQNRYFRL
jgi:endonuclease/exonuclease/phosphatase family metal-dependent hydrolase